MGDCLCVKDGLVLAVAYGCGSAADRATKVAAWETEVAALEARGVLPISPEPGDVEPARKRKPPGAHLLPAISFEPPEGEGGLSSEQLAALHAAIAPEPEWVPPSPERKDGIRLHTLRSAIAAAAELDGEHDILLPTDVYAESGVGQPLAWPRAHRDNLLAATDHADAAGWRARRSADLLKAADTYRQALRDLPLTSPNPATVDWPGRPAAL